MARATYAIAGDRIEPLLDCALPSPQNGEKAKEPIHASY